MVGAALIVFTFVIVSGLLKNLSDPTLAAVVIAASLCLADLLGRLRLWRQRRVEFLLSIAAFLVTKCGRPIAVQGLLRRLGVPRDE